MSSGVDRKLESWDSVVASPGAPGTTNKDTLTITLVAGRNLVCKESKMKVMQNYGKKTSDPYVVATIASDYENEVRSKTVMKNLNPNWKGERLMVNRKLPDNVKNDPFIRFAIIDADSTSSDDPMGQVTIPFESLEAHLTTDKWYPVENCANCNDATGEIRLIIYIGRPKEPEPLPDDVIASIKEAKISKIEAEKQAKAEEKAAAKTKQERESLRGEDTEARQARLDKEKKDKEMADQIKDEKAAFDAEKKRQKEEEKAKREEEKRLKKEEAAAAKAAAVAAASTPEEIAKKEAEKQEMARQQQMKKDEAARQKSIKDSENRAKKAEAARLKAIRDAENKIKREEQAREKAIKDAEIKKKRDEIKKEKLEEQKNKAEIDKFKAVDKKNQVEEEHLKNEEKRAKKAAAAAESSRKKEEARRRKAEQRKEREQRKRHQAIKKKEYEDNFVYDEELGRKVRLINDRSKTEDTCCNRTGYRCCMGISFFFFFVIYPLTYMVMIIVEYKTYGWDRILDRSNGHAYWPEGEAPAPTPAPKGQVSEFDAASSDPPAFDSMYDEEAHPLLWALPLIGVAVGLFANIVPISSGLLLMPLFQEMGVCKSSAATLGLTCAVTFVNNGVFGFTSWCIRDARFFISRALFLCVPFAWAGYAVGVTKNATLSDIVLSNETDEALMHTYLRLTMALLMVSMGFVALFGACIGGANRFCCPSSTGGSTPGGKSFCQWIVVLLCCFNTGYFFVANIGAGMGVTTFFALSVFLGVETKRALPTAIVIGGWTALFPFIVNFFVLDSTPYLRFLMICPGLWFGSILAPWFSKCGGPTSDLVFYGLLLLGVGTAVICFASIALQKGEEDVNIDIEPVFGLDVDAEVVATSGGGTAVGELKAAPVAPKAPGASVGKPAFFF